MVWKLLAYDLVAPMLVLPPEKLQMPFRVRVPRFLNPGILGLMTNPDRLRYDYQYNVWLGQFTQRTVLGIWSTPVPLHTDVR